MGWLPTWAASSRPRGACRASPAAPSHLVIAPDNPCLASATCVDRQTPQVRPPYAAGVQSQREQGSPSGRQQDMICCLFFAGFFLGFVTLHMVVNVANTVCADGCAVIAVPCSWILAQIAKSHGLQHWQWPLSVAGSAAAEGCSQWGAAGWPTMSPSHEPPCKTLQRNQPTLNITDRLN